MFPQFLKLDKGNIQGDKKYRIIDLFIMENATTWRVWPNDMNICKKYN